MDKTRTIKPKIDVVILKPVSRCCIYVTVKPLIAAIVPARPFVIV